MRFLGTRDAVIEILAVFSTAKTCSSSQHLSSHALHVYMQVNFALQELQIRGSSLGSNILKVEVEDYPAAFTYDVRFDEFWNPQSLFRTQTDISFEQAQLACKYDTHIWIQFNHFSELLNTGPCFSKSEIVWGHRCYGFQFIPTNAFNQARNAGSSIATLQDIKLSIVYFYQPPVKVQKIGSYRYTLSQFFSRYTASNGPAAPIPSAMFAWLLTLCAWESGYHR